MIAPEITLATPITVLRPGSAMESSPLRHLAPELRNRIFELALFRVEFVPFGQLRTHAALTQTCRQIRQETYTMFFAGNNFCHQLTLGEARLPVEEEEFQSFLQFLGPETLSLVKRLQVTLLWDAPLVPIRQIGDLDNLANVRALNEILDERFRQHEGFDKKRKRAFDRVFQTYQAMGLSLWISDTFQETLSCSFIFEYLD